MNLNNAFFEISSASSKQFPSKSLPEIVFSGRSNVGKSSLINCLLNRKSLARVSATPGKTVTINFYNIDNACRFVDLPGYGYAKASNPGRYSWSDVVDRYFTDARRCDAVLQLIDIRHEPSEADKTMLDYLERSGIDFAVVLTKSDKLKKSEREQIVGCFKAMTYRHMIAVVPFSSIDRTGKQEVLGMIEKIAGQKIIGASV